MPAPFYRNGFIYLTGKLNQTLNPANYLLNGEFRTPVAGAKSARVATTLPSIGG